jgi:hypothetical protein
MMILAAQLHEGVVEILRRRGDLDSEVTKDPEVEACMRRAQPVLTHPLSPYSKLDDLVVVHVIFERDRLFDRSSARPLILSDAVTLLDC